MFSPIARLFSRRRRGLRSSSASSDSQSLTPYSRPDSDTPSAVSSDSLTSTSTSSARLQALLIDVETMCDPSRAPCFDDNFSESLDSEDAVSLLSNCDSECPSLWVAHISHTCECTPRSKCPYFIQQHIDYLQSHERRCVPCILMSAYDVSADEYAHASDALSLPAAKLARARAEYKWAATRLSDSTRLLAPRFQDRLRVAEAKVAAAEKDLEAASIKRWERAQLLMDVGRF